MSNPLDRWEASIEAGNAAEAALILMFARHLGITLHPNAVDNPKNPDLRGEFLLDSKVLKSPYPSSPTPAGLTQEEHITLDYSNVMEDYPPDTVLAITVDYTGSGVQTKGFYLIPVFMVREIVKNNPNRVYSRSQRSSKDKSKKVAISTKECARLALPSMTLQETVAAILAAQKHPQPKVLPADLD
jgi:hypothetical protein